VRRGIGDTRRPSCSQIERRSGSIILTLVFKMMIGDKFLVPFHFVGHFEA